MGIPLSKVSATLTGKMLAPQTSEVDVDDVDSNIDDNVEDEEDAVPQDVSWLVLYFEE